MNQIRSTAKLSEQELINNVPTSASWHQDFKDTAYVYFGGLPYGLSEGDVLVIFSQYGVPVHMKLVRDKETGKSKGFGWLKYEDQRSTILAVDNLNGAKVLGRLIRVDHAFYEEKEYDEEYEKMLQEELKNDMAEATDEKEEEPVAPKDDEFADPLLLMQKSEPKKEHREHREHRHRHKSSRDEKHRSRDDKHSESRRDDQRDDKYRSSHRSHDKDYRDRGSHKNRSEE